jgi:hypothetical protein
MDNAGHQIAPSDFFNREIVPIVIGLHIPDAVLQVTAKQLSQTRS